MRWKESSDRVLLSPAGGWRVVLMFLGAPILLFGALVVFAALGNMADPSSFDVGLGMLGFGSVLSVVGLLMLGGRSGVIIDQRTREVAVFFFFGGGRPCSGCRPHRSDQPSWLHYRHSSAHATTMQAQTTPIPSRLRVFA
jgi:hypothetical protein